MTDTSGDQPRATSASDTSASDTSAGNTSASDTFADGDAARQQRLNELTEEVSRRCRDGENPSVAEYLAKHPALADDIAELFPALLAIEQSSRARAAALSSAAERVGAVVGRYKLLERIGEGGFGVVFMAEQQYPVRRKVALKVIKPGMDTRQVIARFEAERQALAMMDHPNIAKVHDAGATDSGRPYFVMELVPGTPITDYCDREKLTPRERLELFVQVCHAVQHAHTKGIIHRDLKPTNVLVAMHDGKAVPKVIDFGVAKATGQQPLTEHTLFTQFVQMIGTPLYMSPEQAQQGGLDVDTRSDVYSLGVLLYELLTGTTPFDGKRLGSAAAEEMRRIIREEEPPNPSTRLSTMGEKISAISAQRQTDPKKLGQLMRGELDWIVMKALEKDRARRYETANGLGRDVERYLSDEAVQACPPSARYRLRKLLRKHRVPLMVATGFVLLLVGATVVSSWQALRARRAEALAQARLETEREVRARAVTEAAKATTISGLLQEMFTSANPDQTKGADYTVRQLLEDASLRLSDQLKEQPEVEAAVRAAIGNTYRRLEIPAKAEPHLKRAIEIRRAFADRAPEPLAESLLDYGWNLFMSGRRAEAKQYAREALAIYRRGGAANGKLLETLAALQLFSNEAPYFDEADAIANEAIALGRKHFPNGHPALADVLHRLADSKRARGEVEVAEPLIREAVAMHGRWHGERHPETGWGYWILGEILLMRGERDEAEASYRRALAIFREQYDDSHSGARSSVNRLQEIFTAKGDHAGLAALRADKAARLSKALERETDALKIRMQLGSFLRDTGNLDAALARFSEAVEISTAAPPDVKLSLADGCSKLARLLRDKQRLQPAQQMFRHAVSLREPLASAALPELRLAQANDYNDLAFILLRAKRWAEAEQAVRTAIELKQALVRDFPENQDYQLHLAHSRFGLGYLAADLGRTTDAEQAFSEAAGILNQLAAAEPAGTETLRAWLGSTFWQLGEAWLRFDRFDDAEQANQKALKIFVDLAAEHPANAYYRQEQGYSHRHLFNVAQRAGRTADAERHLRDALAIYSKLASDLPESPFYRQEAAFTARALTDLLLRGRKYEQAESLLLAEYAELQAEPAPQPAQWRDVCYRIFRLYQDWGQQEKLIEWRSKSLAAVEQAIARAPNDVQFQILRSQLLRDSGELDEAIKICSEILSRQPDNDAAWHERGNCYLRKGAFAKAAEDFGQAIKLKPDDAAAWHERGYCHLVLGQHDRAVVDHSKAIELGDHDAGQRLRRGHSYVAVGEFQKAEEDYSRAIELNPRSWESWHARARLYHQQHESNKAQDDLANAVKLLSNPDEQNGMAWRLATDPDPSWRNPRVAVELAEKAIAARPTDGMIWNTVGAARYRSAQWKAAIAALEKSMELREGGDSNDWFFLAMSHWQLGEKDAAREWYDQAVVWMHKNQPNNWELRRFRTEAAELLKIANKQPTTKAESK